MSSNAGITKRATGREACLSCAFCLPNVMAKGDDRCAHDHRRGIAEEGAAYPTIEWMRSPAGPCGPAAEYREPPVLSDIAPRQERMPVAPGVSVYA